MAVTYGMVDGDWTIDRDTKKIRYIGDDHGVGDESYATVIQFHRWLQALADDAVAVGDDELDMTNPDPSRRSTDNIITLINGYTLDTDTGLDSSEHLYDGSIIEGGGTDIWDGIVNFGNANVQIQIIQNGAVLADDWWNQSSVGLNPSSAAGISHRFMIKTRTSGTDIDGRRLIGTCRRWQYTYAEFGINGTSRGNNVLALVDSSDLNNQTAVGTVAGWTGIANTEGYVSLNVDGQGGSENYYSEWNANIPTRTINEFYERMKWLSRDGSTETVYGLNGELFRGITHEIAISGGSGTFTQSDQVTWAGGTGQLIAADNLSGASTTKIWIQLLTGVIPATETITDDTSDGSATTGTVTERAISKPFCGASTGSALIGGYGLGLQINDLTSSDKVTDLDAAVITPPNYVTNTVAGLEAGEDRVLCAPWDGVSTDVNGDPAIDKDQLSLATILDAANENSVVVSEAIPSDTPSEGFIRVTDNDGYERRLWYSSWDTSTFTISGGDYGDGNEDFDSVNANIGNDVYIAYIDVLADAATEAFTSVQSASRNLVVIVRDGQATPIKQFISSWSQTSSAATLTAIRTTDE